MLFRERVILENLTADDLLEGEIKYQLIEPLMKIIRLVGRWYMSLKQG